MELTLFAVRVLGTPDQLVEVRDNLEALTNYEERGHAWKQEITVYPA